MRPARRGANAEEAMLFYLTPELHGAQGPSPRRSGWRSRKGEEWTSILDAYRESSDGADRTTS